jgi:hypothetical protein
MFKWILRLEIKFIQWILYMAETLNGNMGAW